MPGVRSVPIAAGGGPADGAGMGTGRAGHVPMTLPHVKQRTGMIILDGGKGQNRARGASPTSDDDAGARRRGLSRGRKTVGGGAQRRTVVRDVTPPGGTPLRMTSWTKT